MGNTNINYNSLTSTQKSAFGWDVSGGSNINILNYGISNYYPDNSGVTNRYITLERNASIQQSIDISSGVYNLNFNYAYNQYNLLANPLQVYFDGSMVDQLPTSDTFDTLPSTWLNYENNIIAQTNGSHTLKIQGFDQQN